MSMLLAAGLIVFVNRLDVSAQATKASTARIARLEDEARVAQAEATTIRAQMTATQQQAQNQVEALRGQLAQATKDNLALQSDKADLVSHAASDKASLVSANE